MILKSEGENVTDLHFRRMLHPPYSPDIASSDFYLFGIVKNSKRMSTRPIGLTELAGTMRAWITRLQGVIDINGEYA
jgi:hypothetical protein